MKTVLSLIILRILFLPNLENKARMAFMLQLIVKYLGISIEIALKY
jgi:hypothetical protein